MINNNCKWENNSFSPCHEMKKNFHNYQISIYSSYKKMENYELIEIKKCPFCKTILRNNTLIDHRAATTRKFKICNTDRHGHGSFYYIVCDINNSLEDIAKQIIKELDPIKSNNDYFVQQMNLPWIIPIFRYKRMKIKEWDIKKACVKRNGQKGEIFVDHTGFEVFWD